MSQPALNEAALDLAQIDQRREAVAHIVHDVDAPGVVGPGESIDLDLSRRTAT